MDQIKKVLFIRLRLLGDIIFTIPSVELFKRSFPNAEISYLIEENFREAGELIPGIDNLIVQKRNLTIKEHLKFRKWAKREKFDMVIDFHSGPKSSLLTFLTGCRRRIGYKTSNRNWAYTDHVNRRFDNYPTHSVYNQAKLIEKAGADISELPYYPEIKTDDSVFFKKLSDFDFKNTGVIHIGAGNAFREWGEEKFRELIERLGARGIKVVLAGITDKERELGARLSESTGALDMTGRLTLKESFTLIKNASFYFGADSGLLHLASVTKTPLVAIYGPNIPQISGPWRENDVIVVQRNMKCRPCDQRKCIYDTIRCMKEIEVDDVFEAIVRSGK